MYTPDVARRREERMREHLENQLRIVDIATGEDGLVKSYRGQGVEALCLWGEKAAVLVATGGAIEEVDLRTGKTRVLYEGTLGLLHAEGSVLRMALEKGSTIAVGTISGGQFVEEGTVPVGMPGFILRAWGTDGSCLYGVLHRGVTNQLVRVDLGSGRVDCLTEKGKTVQDRAGIGGLARSRKVLFACESPTEPVELWSAREGGAPEKVTQLNIAVSPQELPAVSVIRYGSDGWSMEALLVEPRSPRPSAGWPTLTYLHGGPERCVEASFSELISARAQSAAYWLASKGYAVFLPNFRGSSGYGGRVQGPDCRLPASAAAIRRCHGGAELPGGKRDRRPRPPRPLRK
jgi:hypothetical protein